MCCIDDNQSCAHLIYRRILTNDVCTHTPRRDWVLHADLHYKKVKIKWQYICIQQIIRTAKDMFTLFNIKFLHFEYRKLTIGNSAIWC